MGARRVPKPATEINRQPNRNKIVGAEPATAVKIQQAAKMIAKGKSRATIIEHLQKQWEISAVTAANYYGDALRLLMPENEDEFRKDLIKANAVRLETIYERAMEEGDYKNAKDAIAELNKMIGANGSGVMVGINTDNENNTQQIFIKFDN